MTGYRFGWMTIRYYLAHTGIPINFGLTIGIALIVGTASRWSWRHSRLSYDRMASLLAPYDSPEALAVARDLDSKIEDLLRKSAG